MDDSFVRNPVLYLRIGVLLAALTLLLFGIFTGDTTLIRIESATL